MVAVSVSSSVPGKKNEDEKEEQGNARDGGRSRSVGDATTRVGSARGVAVWPGRPTAPPHSTPQRGRKEKPKRATLPLCVCRFWV